MPYEYREVKCPWCDHVFMWHKNGDEWGYYQYRLKENGKHVGNTTCPQCSMEIIVLEHVFEGLSVDDDRIERVFERII